jgi:hypothetical protein
MRMLARYCRSYSVLVQNSGSAGALASEMLFPIAQAMAKLVCEEDFQYVKACEGGSLHPDVRIKLGDVPDAGARCRFAATAPSRRHIVSGPCAPANELL